MKPEYSVVVPLFNEEEVITESYRRLSRVMSECGGEYELVFVDDGSRDRTLELAKLMSRGDRNVKIVSFSRNFGHQTAITAGMDYASGEAVVVIDADLQDPPELIPAMLAKWREGYQVVYGRRTERQGETLFKKLTAKVFYRFLRAMTDTDIPADAGDFRLLDRRVVEALKSMPERNRYVRGLVSWAGFRQTSVEYVREERFAGKSKYPLKKMLKFASDGLVSFSRTPLRLSTWLGALLCLACLVYLLLALISWLCPGSFMRPDLAAALLLFFNGAVLLMLGINGEYIARIYDEAKKRPLYIVGGTWGFEENGE